MSDWDASDNESPVRAPSAPTIPIARKKWEGEDEESDKSVASAWDVSEDEDEENEKKPAVSAAAAAAAPTKKRISVKQKIAEKEALKAAAKPASANGDDVYDEDEVLSPQEKQRRDKEREIRADLANATDLLGAAALGGTSDKELDKLISMPARTKEDFQELSQRLIEYLLKRHQTQPLYPFFVEHHVRELAMPLKDVEVRKAATALTTLANEKQREQREKASGKKKTKTAGKPTIGSAKATNKLDTAIYDEPLDDFGRDPDDFM